MLKTWTFWILFAITLVLIAGFFNNLLSGTWIDILSGVGMSIIIGIVLVFVFYAFVILPIKWIIKKIKYILGK